MQIKWQSRYVRVVKETDLKSVGLRPRRFEPCCRRFCLKTTKVLFLIFALHALWRKPSLSNRSVILFCFFVKMTTQRSFILIWFFFMSFSCKDETISNISFWTSLGTSRKLRHLWLFRPNFASNNIINPFLVNILSQYLHLIFLVYPTTETRCFHATWIIFVNFRQRSICSTHCTFSSTSSNWIHFSSTRKIENSPTYNCEWTMQISENQRTI